MKRIITMLLSCMMVFSCLNVFVYAEGAPETEEPVTEETETIIEEEEEKEESAERADEIAGSTDGYAYAVLDSEGTLTFFRSLYSYDNGTEGTFADIENNEYTGTVYAGFEHTGGTYVYAQPWYSRSADIKEAVFLENQIIQPDNMHGFFMNCKNLTDIDWSGLDTSNTMYMEMMFSNCSSLAALDLSSFNTSNVKNMNNMFYDCTGLEKLDISSFDTSNVTDMNHMFSSCESLKELDVSSFDTSKTTNMASMFLYCQELTELDVSGFDTSKTTTMRNMFSGMHKLEKLNLRNFSTFNVTDMSGMFSQDLAIEYIDLENFYTANVTNMSRMFCTCPKLKELELYNFYTDKVKDFSYMFDGCTGLTLLDIRNFDTGNAEKMEFMFSYCDLLDKVRLGANFTKWLDDAYLPEGNWKNETTGKTLSEKELYTEYPENAEEYQGVWAKDMVHVKSIEVLEPEQGITMGRDWGLRYKIEPEDAEIQKVKYYTEDPSIIEPGFANRTIVGKKIGKTTVTIVTDDGGLEAKCEVRVLFDDVAFKSQYYYDAVYWAVDNNITTGMGPTTFNPTGNCKRYQFVLFLWRQANCPEPERIKTDPFEDVLKDPNKDIYETAVLWAVENGITTGTTPTTFEPYAPLTRGQVVTFLYRAAHGEKDPGIANPFKDVDSSKYYYIPVLWAVKHEITTGVKPDQFQPTVTCTRGQTVVFLYRQFK